jgi:two-component system nitrate/nitrite response regulator NarL
MAEQIRVMLAEDDEGVAKTIERLLAPVPDVQMVGRAPDGQVALELLSERHPDVLLLDLVMPVMDGFEVARRLKAAEEGVPPPPRVLVLSQHHDRQTVSEALRAGADGYLVKSASLQNLPTAIRILAGGGHFLCALSGRYFFGVADTSAGTQPIPVDHPMAGSRLDVLSEREIEVLSLVAAGRSNKEIATELGVSVRTVESHRERIRDKLEVSNVADLVRLAVREGL